jgi:general secretion pathway protein A
MYKSYFGISRNPFDLTPDPACFVPTSRHNEALAALYYGVRQHKGVIVVTGEVGTGKTLLLRCLLRLLKESRDIAYAYLFNCRLTSTELLYYTLSDFGLSVSDSNKGKLLLDLSKFVTSRGLAGQTTVLIIDEAHHLSSELLEEIRLLSNLETNDEKLLQIVLVGQPELDEKLDSYELRPLKQRIALRAHLGALSPKEVKKYIDERMRIAGLDPSAKAIFSDAAILKVFRYSRGLPRLINTICENALITCYARSLPVVSPEVVTEVANDFHLADASFEDADDLIEDLEGDAPNNLLLELYAKLQQPVGKLEPIEMQAETQVRDHEPNL